MSVTYATPSSPDDRHAELIAAIKASTQATRDVESAIRATADQTRQDVADLRMSVALIHDLIADLPERLRDANRK